MSTDDNLHVWPFFDVFIQILRCKVSSEKFEKPTITPVFSSVFLLPYFPLLV